jgi:NAD(P)-dependent dehydrogenase (short-subunit alcohol dehydrogenase family)
MSLGANRGIGFELARQLSRNATVIGTARNPAKAEKLQALVNVHVVAMDITSPKSVEAAAEEVAKLAPEGIDELWNNAAQLSVTGLVTEAIDTKEWLAEIQTNVIGQSLVTRNLLPLLRKGQGKKLVFISSEAGSVSTIPGDDDKVVYCSSKAALNMTIKVGVPGPV